MGTEVATPESQSHLISTKGKKAPNIILYELRLSHDLKLKEAAGGIGISRLSLYLYERGYRPLNEKAKRAVCSFYQVDASLFDDPLGYPTPIEPKAQKLSPFLRWLFSLKGFIVSLTLCALSWGAFGGGYALAYHSRDHALEFYDDNYISFCSRVIEKGEASEDGLTSSYSYKASDGNSFSVTVNLDAHLFGSTDFSLTFDSDDGHSVSLNFIQNSTALRFNFVDIDIASLSEVGILMGSGTIVEGTYHVSKIVFGASLGEIDSETVYQQLEERIAPEAKLIEGYYAGLVAGIGYTGNEDFYQMLTLQGKGHAAQLRESNAGDNLLLFGSILGAAFAFLSLLCLVMFLGRKKKKALPILEDSDLESVSFNEVKPLKKNWSIFPFLPETVLRLASVGLVLTSSIILFRLVYSLFHAGALDISTALQVFQDGKSFLQMQNYVVAATMLWFFIRIEIMSKRNAAIYTAISFAFMGVLYYIGIDMIGFYLEDVSDAYHLMLLTVLKLILPGNVFWGIGAFALLVLFIGTTPKGYSTGKRILWHSLGLFPMAYLLGSYFYQVGTSLWGWSEWPEWAANLLFRKQFASTVFAILFPFGVTWLRHIIRRKYGEDQAEKYFEGNAYYFEKNLIACLIIAAIATVNGLMKDSSFAKALDLKRAVWVWVLIPPILFYHPRIGERSQKLDLAFTVAYLFSFGLGYGYLAYFVLFL